MRYDKTMLCSYCSGGTKNAVCPDCAIKQIASLRAALESLSRKVIAAPSRDQDIPMQVEGAWTALKEEAVKILADLKGSERNE